MFLISINEIEGGVFEVSFELEPSVFEHMNGKANEGKLPWFWHQQDRFVIQRTGGTYHHLERNRAYISLRNNDPAHRSYKTLRGAREYVKKLSETLEAAAKRKVFEMVSAKPAPTVTKFWS